MSYSNENGYSTDTIQIIITDIMNNINTQFGLSYTYENFVGTNFYKYFYAIAQRLQQNETKTAEIFLKLQDYFALTNERIARPVVTPNGMIEKFASEGWLASVKPMIDADAGKINICVDVDETGDNYASEKLEICTIIKDSCVAGCVTQGTEVESITLSNGQSFDFKFHLPDRIEPLLRLTVTLSENNQDVILTPDEQKAKLIENIAARYSLGKNFEPQRYYSLVDAPWASNVLLEYSIDAGVNWLSNVYDSDFDELFVISLANITLVEA